MQNFFPESEKNDTTVVVLIYANLVLPRISEK